MEYPPNTIADEVPTQNGLENVRIISCRSLAGVNLESEEKLPRILEDENGESIGFSETILEQMNPEIAVQKDTSYCNGAVISCSNVPSSTVKEVSNLPDTSASITTSEYSPTDDCSISIVATAVCKSGTEKAPTAMPANGDIEEQDQENLATKNYHSSQEALPVAMDVSAFDESNTSLSSIPETTLSDDARAPDVNLSSSVSTESSLKSITEMCNKLPNIPQRKQTCRTTPSFTPQRKIKMSTLRTQELLQRQSYEHPQSQKIPERLNFKIENPPSPQKHEVTGIDLGEIRQRNTKTSTLMKVQKVFERQAYDNKPQSQPPVYQPDDFPRYQAQCYSGVDKGTVHHYGAGGNVFKQLPEISRPNTTPSFAVEQSGAQQLQGAEIYSRTLTTGVYLNNQAYPSKYMPRSDQPEHSNQPYPSNGVYFSNRDYPGNQAYSSQEMYPSKAYAGSNFNCSSHQHEDYNYAHFRPPIDHNQPRYYSNNLYSPTYTANHEHRIYPATNASESYPGYASYGDGYLYCECAQCHQAAMNQPVNVHMADGRDKRHSSYSDRGDEWISAEYNCRDTWLSDIYTEMSSLIPGECRYLR